MNENNSKSKEKVFESLSHKGLNESEEYIDNSSTATNAGKDYYTQSVENEEQTTLEEENLSEEEKYIEEDYIRRDIDNSNIVNPKEVPSEGANQSGFTVSIPKDQSLEALAVLDREALTNNGRSSGKQNFKEEEEETGKHAIRKYLMLPSNPSKYSPAISMWKNSLQPTLNCGEFLLPRVKNTMWKCDTGSVEFGSTCFLQA